MNTFFNTIPREFFEFVVIALFSLIIGLSQKSLHAAHAGQTETTFGTDRTFTFIGILGYILWVADAGHWLYVSGFLGLLALLSINYFNKIKLYQDFGLTTVTIALITYSLTALLRTQPFWLFMTVFVIVLVLTELKDSLNALSRKVEREEFITLGKFLAIAGIILPMVPDTPIVSFLDLTPYRIWLAVVVISAISYFSYLLRKFVFRESGLLVTGILGGLYSSTATTIVLARISKKSNGGDFAVSAAIILSSTMMYVRVGILMAIFNMSLFLILYPWFLLMFATSLVTALVISLAGKSRTNTDVGDFQGNTVNPLEFRIAVIFTLLYVAFTFITYFTLQKFGSQGLQVLAYLVGVSDIDPFLINLFNGKFGIELTLIAVASVQAILSNNVLKLCYGMLLSGKRTRKLLLAGFGIMILVNFIAILML